MKPLAEYYTGVEFAAKLDEGFYLVGAGVWKESIIKMYAVAMYSSPAVLVNAVSPKALQAAVNMFDSSTPSTTFLLEMVYGVSAEKIASAIAESVKPRYRGRSSDIDALESLIIEGVAKIGGQAVKGTVFRFDCSSDGVSVTVDDSLQGMASFKDLGRAFVDVFMDDNAVSPTLVDNCISSWSGNEAKALAKSLHEASQAESTETPFGNRIESDNDGNNRKQVFDQRQELAAVESQLKPLAEYYTGVEFAAKLDEGLYLVGAGVRKKSIIKIYAVAMYSSPAVLVNAVSPKALQAAVNMFDSSTPSTTFLLEMVYGVSAEKIASAIAESVKPRYRGRSSDIDALESLIIEGVAKIGGQAVKGTVFRFDCSSDGVSAKRMGEGKID